MAPDLETVMVHSSNLSVFADISSYNLLQEERTKAFVTPDDMIPLINLLDTMSVSTLEFEDKVFVQIPFVENENNQVKSYIKSDRTPDCDSLVTVHKYLIEVLQNQMIEEAFVTTMITSPFYFENRKVERFDFLNKASYCGLILFSDLDGTLSNVCFYENGQILPAELLPSGLVDSIDCANRITIYEHSRNDMTRSNSDGSIEELDASCCIADREPLVRFINTCFVVQPSHDNSIVANRKYSREGGSGSGGVSTPITQTGNDKKTDIKYTIDISSNVILENPISGEFTLNSVVFINPRPLLMYNESTKEFKYWKGSFEGRPQAFSLTVKQNYSATAYFSESAITPCADTIRNVGNPLHEMAIAPSGKGGWNQEGGTYGLTRNGGTSFHNGIDLMQEEGAPIYAIADGIVSVKPVTEQPMRIDKSYNYPEGYNGDIDDAGNRVSISSIINGERVVLSYWHLQAGNAVAVNPRTRRTFDKGDIVYRGEIIGYVGRTGNANSEQCAFAHLHLNAKVNGKSVNPMRYINGELDKDNRTITNIKCENDGK